MRLGVVAWVSIVVLTGSGTSFADVLGFDDITTNESASIPYGYGGLNWDTFNVGKARIWTGSGYYNGLVSGDYVAFNWNGNPAEISSTPFNLAGAYFTGAWRDGLAIDIVGYRDTTVAYTYGAVVNTKGPMWVTLDFSNVTRVTFTSHGGTKNPNMGLDGTQFVMENMEYSRGGSTHCPGVSTEGLVAFYDFEGDASDKSGNGLNGTLPTEPRWLVMHRGALSYRSTA